MFALRSV